MSMSVSYWNDQSTKENSKEFDIVVIGGGVAGVSTVYWLTKQDPSLRIALVEKGTLGIGATGRNAGFITCGSVEHFNRLVGHLGEEKALEIWKFSETNLELLKQEIFSGMNDSDIEFEQKGSFSLASTENEFDELKKSADLMKKMGINVEVLNKNDIKDRVGAVNFVGGVKYCDDASVNPIKLLNKIVEKCGDFTLIENTQVYDIVESAEGQVLKTNNGTINCSAAVMATNAYSANLKKYFKDKILPTRGQIMIMESVDKFMEGPCYANFVLDYFRQLPNGKLIIGGFRQLNEEIKSQEVGYSDQVTDEIQEALHEFVKEYIPQFKDKKVTHRWAGIMGFSADGHPILGNLPDNQGVYFLGGFTAHGLGLAFHSAKKITDLILEGKALPDWLSAKRF